MIYRNEEGTVDKDKNLPVPREVSRVDIPPNMTTDDYHQMNLRPGHRIGLEYKQKYINTLSDLYVEGYLTEEEYDKRTAWVNEAQTSEQVEIAFMDLQRSLALMKVKDYLKPETHKDNIKSTGLVPMFVFICAVFIFGVTLEAVAHVWFAAAILFAELAGVIWYMVRTVKKLM